MSKDLKNKIVSCCHQKLEMVCGHKETQRLNYFGGLHKCSPSLSYPHFAWQVASLLFVLVCGHKETVGGQNSSP